MAERSCSRAQTMRRRAGVSAPLCTTHLAGHCGGACPQVGLQPGAHAPPARGGPECTVLWRSSKGCVHATASAPLPSAWLLARRVGMCTAQKCTVVGIATTPAPCPAQEHTQWQVSHELFLYRMRSSTSSILCENRRDRRHSRVPLIELQTFRNVSVLWWSRRSRRLQYDTR